MTLLFMLRPKAMATPQNSTEELQQHFGKITNSSHKVQTGSVRSYQRAVEKNWIVQERDITSHKQ